MGYSNVTGDLNVQSTITSQNVYVAGVLRATSLYGDGYGLSNIQASNIVGLNVVYGNTLSNLNASNLAFGVVQASLLLGNTISNIQASNIVGLNVVYGNTLSNLNASNLAFGVVSSSRLYGNTLSNIQSSNVVQPFSNLAVSNAVTTTNVFASTSTLTGTAGRPTLNLTGNIYVSNAITVTNVFATGVGVGTNNPSSYTLQVSGTIGATADITAFISDERLKTKTGTLDNALDKVCTLETFTYTHNDLARSLGFTDNRHYVGISAQQIQKVLPETVRRAPFDSDTIEGVEKSKSGQDYLTVQYDRIVPLLIEAVKEERKAREALEARIKLIEEK